MDIQERADLAVQLKQGHGCNCCHAVLYALKDQMKFTDEEINALGAGFGLGMGNMEATCGALVGAAIALGFSSNGNKAAVRALNERFKELCGSITCEDLKGRFTGKVLCPCNDCVRNAVIAYGEIINKL